MIERTLHVKVGQPLASSLERAAQAMDALERGAVPEVYFSVGFLDIGQFLSVFTRHRWDLLALLRQNGPMTVSELARRAKRDYGNVDRDVEQLVEWGAVDKDEAGRVMVPFSDIVVEIHLPPGIESASAA